MTITPKPQQRWFDISLSEDELATIGRALHSYSKNPYSESTVNARRLLELVEKAL